MTLVVAVWGSTFVVIKGALADATPVAFNLIRMTLAFVLLGVAYHRAWRTIGGADRCGSVGWIVPGGGISVSDDWAGADDAIEVGVYYRAGGCSGAVVFNCTGAQATGRARAAVECVSRVRLLHLRDRADHGAAGGGGVWFGCSISAGLFVDQSRGCAYARVLDFICVSLHRAGAHSRAHSVSAAGNSAGGVLRVVYGGEPCR